MPSHLLSAITPHPKNYAISTLPQSRWTTSSSLTLPESTARNTILVSARLFVAHPRFAPTLSQITSMSPHRVVSRHNITVSTLTSHNSISIVWHPRRKYYGSQYESFHVEACTLVSKGRGKGQTNLWVVHTQRSWDCMYNILRILNAIMEQF